MTKDQLLEILTVYEWGQFRRYMIQLNGHDKPTQFVPIPGYVEHDVQKFLDVVKPQGGVQCLENTQPQTNTTQP